MHSVQRLRGWPRSRAVGERRHPGADAPVALLLRDRARDAQLVEGAPARGVPAGGASSGGARPLLLSRPLRDSGRKAPGKQNEPAERRPAGGARGWALAPAEDGAEEEPVWPEDPPRLGDGAREVVRPVEAEAADHDVEGRCGMGGMRGGGAREAGRRGASCGLRRRDALGGGWIVGASRLVQRGASPRPQPRTCSPARACRRRTRRGGSPGGRRRAGRPRGRDR